jgi:hypothetical protein
VAQPLLLSGNDGDEVFVVNSALAIALRKKEVVLIVFDL